MGGLSEDDAYERPPDCSPPPPLVVGVLGALIGVAAASAACLLGLVWSIAVLDAAEVDVRPLQTAGVHVAAWTLPLLRVLFLAGAIGGGVGGVWLARWVVAQAYKE